MKAARTVMVGLATAMLLATSACSRSGPSDVGAVPTPPTTTTQPPPTLAPASTSTSSTKPGSTPASTTTTASAPRPTTTQALEPVWTRFTSATYKVALAYPPDWPEPADATASPPHFFALSAASGAGQPLATTCRNAASHRLRPFGSTPAVKTELSFAGQPACVIEPSADQLHDNRGMAQLMVRYPTPLQLRNDLYEILVVTAHVRHISAIAATLSFVG